MWQLFLLEVQSTALLLTHAHVTFFDLAEQYNLAKLMDPFGDTTILAAISGNGTTFQSEALATYPQTWTPFPERVSLGSMLSVGMGKLAFEAPNPDDRASRHPFQI